MDAIKELAKKNAEPITVAQGEKLAQKIQADCYMECSAKTQDGLKEVFDRAITDSLFYYEFYVDKSKLDNKKDYFGFHKFLINKVSLMLNQIDLLIEFKPLKNCNVNDDKMRPAYLEEASYSEYTCIHRLNYTYRRKDNVQGFMSINLNNECNNNCIEQIIDKIKETCKAQGR